MASFLNRESMAAEMKARYQRAGFLHKLPMSKGMSERWQKRLFVAKDGYLLYYAASGPANPTHFDTKPKGVIPLGGCKVDLVERGPKGSRYGLRITHPDFYAGRMLILASDSSDDQKGWLEVLNDCSRVTMENAKLGDAMIEKLRAIGTVAEKEKNDVIDKLQQQALALKMEQEEKLRLQTDTEELRRIAADAEQRAKKKDEEMAVALAEVEKERQAMIGEAADIQRAIDERDARLASSQAEYERIQTELASAQSKGLLSGELETKAKNLEEEKLRLEHEKNSLERSVRDLSSSTQQLQSTLQSAEEHRKQLEHQLRDISSSEADLAKERQLRKRLERKLQIAEDSLKRLDQALKRSGVKLDVDVFADVKTLLSFFEERAEDNKRDAQRIEIMKKALTAKRRYLVATAKTDVEGEAADKLILAEIERHAKEGDEAWEKEDYDNLQAKAAILSPARIAPAQAVVAAATSKAGTPAAELRRSLRLSFRAKKAADDSDAESANPDHSDDEGDKATGPVGSDSDELGPLPAGWQKFRDDVGDEWYYNASMVLTSWLRPNPDGSVPES